MRLTCSSLSLLGVPIADAVETIAGLGFPAMDLVGIPSVPDPHLDLVHRDPAELGRLRHIVDACGLQVATVVAVPGDGLEQWDPAEVDARVRWAIAACNALGAPLLVLDAGSPDAGGGERQRAIALWKAMIDAAADGTAAAGVRLAVEAPHTGTLAERFDEVDELLRAIARPEVGLDYDTSHVHRSGTSTEESLERVGDRLVKVALRDVDAAGEFCAPGTGEVDFARLLTLLKRRQFDGDLVIELETPGVTAATEQQREIEMTRLFVEDILAGL